MKDEWLLEARLSQYPLTLGRPPLWMVTGGRGSGKTRLGAEWVIALARGLPPFTEAGLRYNRIALIGETLADAREVMIEGASGIVAIARADRPRYEPSRRRLLWPSGAVAQIFSSEDPESLRGPQFEAAWCDELAKWKNADATFDMLQFGLRLGTRPMQMVTTTPRPTRLMKRLLADPATVVTRMRTSENAMNLAPTFLKSVEQRYAGTALGRQELDGELIDDREDALWSRQMLLISPVADELRRIVVAVDPPASSHKTSDACGMNQGGEMAGAVIATVDPSVPIKAVRARRGKWLRAEPVAALYQQGRVRHAARFVELEDEMCDFGPDGSSNGHSPDRVDALVWAITELVPDWSARPRIRDFF